jgi:hypothetical protein
MGSEVVHARQLEPLLLLLVGCSIARTVSRLRFRDRSRGLRSCCRHVLVCRSRSNVEMPGDVSPAAFGMRYLHVFCRALRPRYCGWLGGKALRLGGARRTPVDHRSAVAMAYSTAEVLTPPRAVEPSTDNLQMHIPRPTKNMIDEPNGMREEDS